MTTQFPDFPSVPENIAVSDRINVNRCDGKPVLAKSTNGVMEQWLASAFVVARPDGGNRRRGKKGNEGTYRRTQRSPVFLLAEILEIAATMQRWARCGAVMLGLVEEKTRMAIDAVWWKEIKLNS